MHLCVIFKYMSSAAAAHVCIIHVYFAVFAVPVGWRLTGGRKAYQDASLIAVKMFNTSKHVFQLMTRFGLRPGKGEPPLRVLEVGAINCALHVRSQCMRVHCAFTFSKFSVRVSGADI